MVVFDHVEATMEGNQIKITNPTKFDAQIRIFIDADVSKPYSQGFVNSCPQVFVKAGTSEMFTINGNTLVKN